MSRRWIWTTLVLAAAFATALLQRRAPAEAKPTAAASVAVIDIVKIFNAFQQTNDLNKAFDSKKKQIQAEAEKRRELLLQTQKNLEAYKPGDADYKEREQEAMRAEIDLRTWLTYTEESLKRKHKYWLEQTYQKVCAAAGKVAADKGYVLVLTYEELDSANVKDSSALMQQIARRKVIYASAQVDITDETLNRLNLDYKQSGGIKVTF